MSVVPNTTFTSLSSFCTESNDFDTRIIIVRHVFQIFLDNIQAVEWRFIKACWGKIRYCAPVPQYYYTSLVPACTLACVRNTSLSARVYVRRVLFSSNMLQTSANLSSSMNHLTSDLHRKIAISYFRPFLRLTGSNVWGSNEDEERLSAMLMRALLTSRRNKRESSRTVARARRPACGINE